MQIGFESGQGNSLAMKSSLVCLHLSFLAYEMGIVEIVVAGLLQD